MSRTDDKKYSEKRFSRTRILITDPLEAAKKKNIVCGVSDLNISQFRKDAKEKGVGFFSKILFAISRAVEKNPKMNSYRKGRKKIVEFRDVDICFMVERETGDGKMPLPYIIRNANSKTLEEIDNELKDAKTKSVDEIYLHKNMRLYMKLPKFARRLFWKFILKNPHQFKKNLGTVAVTALHGKSFGPFHFNPITPHTFTAALGGIYKSDKNEYMMKITLCIDHDILDGMDAMKFYSSFANS